MNNRHQRRKNLAPKPSPLGSHRDIDYGSLQLQLEAARDTHPDLFKAIRHMIGKFVALAAEARTLQGDHDREIARLKSEHRDALKLLRAQVNELENISRRRYEKALADIERRSEAATRPVELSLDFAGLLGLADQSEELAACAKDRDTYAELLDHAEQERDQALRDRARLAARLTAFHVDPDTDPRPGQLRAPETFRDLLHTAEQRWPGLTFTWFPGPPLLLDRHSDRDAWLARAVAALDALHGYRHEVAAGRHTGTLISYLRAGHMTVPLSPRSVALHESDTVQNNPELALLRRFPVPAMVNPDGAETMHAHIRIGGVRPPAPRMHFFDAAANSGLIVVGYLGEHLRSARTN